MGQRRYGRRLAGPFDGSGLAETALVRAAEFGEILNQRVVDGPSSRSAPRRRHVSAGRLGPRSSSRWISRVGAARAGRRPPGSRLQARAGRQARPGRNDQHRNHEGRRGRGRVDGVHRARERRPDRHLGLQRRGASPDGSSSSGTERRRRSCGSARTEPRTGSPTSSCPSAHGRLTGPGSRRGPRGRRGGPRRRPPVAGPRVSPLGPWPRTPEPSPRRS